MEPYLDISTFDNFFQLVFDNAPIFIFWKDLHLIYLGCNQNYANVLGLKSPADIVGKTDYDLWPSEAEKYRKDDKEIIETGKPKEKYEETVILHDGSVVLVETTKVPLCDTSKNIIGVLGLYRDITNEREIRNNIEKRLKAQLYRISHEEVEENTLIIPALVFWKDKKSVYLGCNQNFAFKVGLNHYSEVIGKTDYDFWSEEEATESINDDRYILETGKSKERYEEAVTLHDGTHIWVETTKIPFRDEFGEIIGVLGLHRDITIERAKTKVKEVLSKYPHLTSIDLHE